MTDEVMAAVEVEYVVKESEIIRWIRVWRPVVRRIGEKSICTIIAKVPAYRKDDKK